MKTLLLLTLLITACNPFMLEAEDPQDSKVKAVETDITGYWVFTDDMITLVSIIDYTVHSIDQIEQSGTLSEESKVHKYDYIVRNDTLFVEGIGEKMLSFVRN